MDGLTFGQFLFQEGLVSYDDILKAKILQKKGSKKLGSIAQRFGLLTAEQVERILREQDETGLAFGQIAIRDHYLTAGQIEFLLSHQLDNTVEFHDALIAVGAMTPAVHAVNVRKYEVFKTGLAEGEGDGWFKIEFHGTVIEVDDEGFLKNADDWSEAFAGYIAGKERIVLEEQHWNVIRFIRRYYRDYRVPPMPNVILKAMNTLSGGDAYSIKTLCGLFHGSSMRKACQLAGLPKPPGCT